MRRSTQQLARLPSYSEKGRRAREAIARQRRKKWAKEEAELAQLRLQKELTELERLRNEHIAPVD